MSYGKGNKYGRSRVIQENVQSTPPCVPTFICSHCGGIKTQSDKTITLTAVKNNAIFISGRVCEDCGKLLVQWTSKK
jgi:hypothetical protein